CHVHKDAVIPRLVELRAEQKYSVHEQDRVVCRILEVRWSRGIDVDVESRASIHAFTTWSKWQQQQLLHGLVIVGVLVVADRRHRSLTVPLCSRMVEAIDRRSDNIPLACPNYRSELVSQACLAGNVNAINCYSDWMWSVD